MHDADAINLATLPPRQLKEFLTNTVRPDDGFIPAYIFSHPVIHQLEMEKIFMTQWLFLAHESELPKVGDFVTRDLGGHSVIISRGQDNQVRIFLNMCRHRGMRLCRDDRGNEGAFHCPYHGFTYSNLGLLTGVPFQRDIYGDGFDKQNFGLIQAKVEIWAGLIFGTWSANPPSVKEFLGPMAWYLDLVVNRAEMEVTGPPQRWVVNASWKLGADNFVHDSYHTMYTHASIAKLGMVPAADYSKQGYQIDCGQGHGLNFGTPTPDFIFPQNLMDEYRSRLTSEQFSALSTMKNMIGTVFPNLSFLISATTFKGSRISNTTLRTWIPKGPGQVEVLAWVLTERNATPEWKEASLQSSMFTFSPSGIFEQDDMENFIDITANSRGALPLRDNIAFAYLAGLGRQPVEQFPWPGTAYDSKFLEHNARSFYRAWLKAVTSGGE
ncbi:MAG: aromatic ring-hydroxylating dioxygenase subunit alpha [Sulfobacillus benefaciens]|uniref:Aromatic ring-hydroxylating dioxygenase subunit alpha n=1 Tax=Sulfobacillus benefaciens TaxID=453960 RepID=A0A2T2XH40_9FIRM|nr:MAG: aromatic ring-hydroxylating dioxygenase subunit alpha [Sulfobacillus benefaciens]